jgi:hypothetical protein
MVSREEKDGDNIKRVIAILKRTTLIVKLVPFFYSFLTCVSIIAYMMVSDTVCAFLDTMFYTSPLTIFVMFLLSYSLKLCKWHRLECALPLLPTLVGLLDNWIDIVEYAALLNCLTVTVIILLSILNAIKMFLWKKTFKQ